jgi:hypothetical protein
MTRMEFDALRLRYRAALAAYDRHATSVLDHSKGGQAPPARELFAEEQALYELTNLRRELLDGLAAVQRAH